MSGKEEARIFVGGLSWNTTERQLDATFSRFGKVLDVQIMMERDTGRPRGFGFVTFSNRRAMEAAISEMHNKEFGGRPISVNKAEPKAASDDIGYGYGGGGYSSGGGRGGYRGDADESPPIARFECFKCGRLGHLARECTSGGGERFSSHSRIGGGRGDRFDGGGDRYGERYADDRYDGGGRYDGSRYGDRDHLDGKDGRYGGSGGVRDRYASNRYPPDGDRFSGERFGDRPDKYPSNGYNKERTFDGNRGPRNRGSGGNGGGYRERTGPYDRPKRGGPSPSLDDRY